MDFAQLYLGPGGWVGKNPTRKTFIINKNFLHQIAYDLEIFYKMFQASSVHLRGVTEPRPFQDFNPENI